jgi:4-amino-4-deoxy-L-arabinose transferase-like glycosyltransferase
MSAVRSAWRSVPALLVSLCVLAACLLSGVVLRNPLEWFRLLPYGLTELCKRATFLPAIYVALPQFALLIVVLLLLGMLLGLVSTRVICAWDAPRHEPRSSDLASSATYELASAAHWPRRLLVAVLVANLALWICLWAEWYRPVFLPLWGLGLVLMAVAWARLGREPGASLASPFSTTETIGLLVWSLAFALYAGFLGTSWRYAWASDELVYFSLGRRLYSGEAMNAFSPAGAFGYHPVLGSIWVSWFMRLLGPTVLAWRLSSAVAVGLAIPALYLFVREIVSRRAAVVAAVLFAANHTIFTFALKGFNNGHAFAPTFWALATWCLAVRRRSGALMFVAGVATGLGFYVYYTARLTLAFLLLAFAFVLPWKDWRQTLSWAASYAAGFAFTVIPLLLSGTDFIELMVRETSLRGSDHLATSWVGVLWEKAFGSAALVKWQWAILEPLFSERVERFVSGSFLDPWSASLSLVGIGWLLVRGWRGRVLPWLLGCTFLTMLIAGVLAKYDIPPLTRMAYVVPFHVIFAALAIDVLASAWIALPLGRTAGLAIAAGFALLSVAANQYRLLVETPQRDSVDPHGLVVKLAQTSSPQMHFYYVVPEPHEPEPYFLMADIYGYAERAHWLRPSTLIEASEELQAPAMIVFARMYPASLDPLIELVRRRYPEHEEHVVRSAAGTNEVVAIVVQSQSASDRSRPTPEPTSADRGH